MNWSFQILGNFLVQEYFQAMNAVILDKIVLLHDNNIYYFKFVRI